jgi:glutathione S-transferase
MEKAVFFCGTKNASSWAMRAWLALRDAEFEFMEELVDIRRPQRFAALARIGAFSPSRSVPALVVGNAALFDSMAIMEFANDVAGGRLLPSDTLRRAEARSIVAWQHSGLSGICARISFESSFYPIKRQLTESERAECRRLFEFVEPILAESGGPFLFGSATLADFALAPTVVRLSRHDEPKEEYSLARRWATAVLDHPLVGEWLSEADRLPHIWFDDYLVPGKTADSVFDLEFRSSRSK